MKRAVVAIALLVLSGFVTPPAGWREQQGQATELAAKTSAVAHFGGAPSVVTSSVHASPDGSAVMYITVVTATLREHRDEAARIEIDGFLRAATRAKLASAKVSIGMNASGANTRKKQLEIVHEWRDEQAGIETKSRLVVVADAERMVALSADCVFGSTAATPTREACSKALETLDPGIAADQRVALSLAPEGTALPDAATPPTTGTSSHPMSPHQTMSELAPSRAPLPPIAVRTETKRTTDQRPMYVGLGIVLLAAVFWWNRRRRERFEAEGSYDDDER